MNWWPNSCEYGDIIRVHLGSVDHYGIFVTEEEVLQFGMPPVAEYRMAEQEVVVLSTDIDTFACGNIIEVASFDKKEAKTAFSKEQIVQNARAKLGTGGYDILGNNCEHFVYECAFGTKHSSQEENIKKKWNKLWGK